MTRLFAALFLIAGESVLAQELEPRAYSPSPIGTKFVLAGFGGSEGGILFDPSLDVANVEADLQVVTAGFGYTFPLAGRQARVLAVFPSAWGTIGGEVDGQAQTQEVSGLVFPQGRPRWRRQAHGSPPLCPCTILLDSNSRAARNP